MKILLREGGLLEIPARLLKRFRFTVDTPFGLAAPHARLMWLVNEPDRLPAGATEDNLKLTGTLDSLSVADIFSLLNMSQRSGVIVFLFEQGEKNVWFDGGEILFASSSLPEDRIGQVLMRLGKLSEPRLREAEKSLPPGARFGAHLVQNGFLEASALSDAVRHQVEEILYSLFNATSGSFMFFDGVKVAEDLVQFSLNTQNILMEAFQRVDEWKVIRKNIPSEHAVAKLTDKPRPPKLPPSVLRILDAVDGARSVEQIMRHLSLGAFPVYRGLHDAVQLGLAILEQPQKAAEEPAGIERFVRDFNKLFRTATTEIRAAGEINLGLKFQDYVHNLPAAAKAILLDLQLRTDGTLDENTLVQRVREAVQKKGGSGLLAGMNELLEQQALISALNEALNFYLFTAQSHVPKARAERLVAAIRNVQKNILAKTKG